MQKIEINTAIKTYLKNNFIINSINTTPKLEKRVSLSRVKNNAIKDSLIMGVSDLFRSKKENKAIKDKEIKDIRSLSESKKEEYLKPKKIADAFNDRYIEYKSEVNEKLSIKRHFKKIKPLLCDMRGKLKKLGEWKIHLRMKVIFMS